MKNLLKADFYALFKDKASLITIIITAVLALFTILINYAILQAAAIFMEIPNLSDYLSGNEFIYSAMSISGDIGLLLPIMISIMAVKEFRNGTIRNKIIHGHSRTKIYFSKLIVFVSFGLVMFLVYFGITTLMAVGMLGFKSGTAILGNDFADISARLLLSILQFIILFIFTVTFSFITRNVGFQILIVLGTSFISTILVSIVLGVPGITLPAELVVLLSLLPSYQNTIITDYSGFYAGTGLVPEHMGLIFIFSSIVYLGSFTFFGVLTANKVDFK